MQTAPEMPISEGFISGYVLDTTSIAMRGYTFTHRKQNVVVTYEVGDTGERGRRNG